MQRRTSYFIRLIALCLILSLCFPVSANATEASGSSTRASRYLDAYSAYVHVTSGGQVQVWFEVMGTGDMDEIGALSIMLYESSDGSNWTLVKTFLHNTTSGMLYEDDYYVSSHVSWDKGSVSKQYKAYVGVYAGKNDTGDTRYFWAYEP